MKVLVACEESQAVTIELRKLGHEKKNQLDQLTNNWNELEEWLKDLFEKGYDIKLVLDKMQEIKGGNNEKN